MQISIQHCSLKLRTCALVSSVLLAGSLFGVTRLVAQAPSTRSSAPARQHKPHPRAHAAAAHSSAAATQASPPPPQPVTPNWPINDQPAPATIAWDSSGLRIVAANSSLKQILRDVSTATGAKVEGVGADERVFGNYGPGSLRDVLSQLLQGSGYNLLMVGDQAHGAPLQIVLSARQSGNAPAVAGAQPPQSQNDDDADSGVDDQVQPVPISPPLRPGFGPGGPVRTPQQVMEEMQRQQEQQQQQQQQQQQPGNIPPNE
jgi:hypothetical protein